jgi:ketosteroid isomerase-like protein
MESRKEIGAPEGSAAKPDLAAVERVYELIDRDGVVAGVEELLTFCHEDVELRAYSARATGTASQPEHELLHGRDEVLAFFRTRVESGFGFRIRARGFEADADTVFVRGSIRLARPDGSFAESSVRWKFHFRDGLVDEISWEPRAGG